VGTGRTLPWDWHPGVIPENVLVDETAYVETSFSFTEYRSGAAIGVQIGKGSSTYSGTMFDVGKQGRVRLGDYVLVHGARIICDAEIEVGDYTFISWNVVLMDTYRAPFDPIARRRIVERLPFQEERRLTAETPGRPIYIGRAVWIGFDVCILPGVTIGDGAIVGARSVVLENVEPYTIVGGNPARLMRRLDVKGIDYGR
jgi:acetyltransferase-like isoleucine patch superfamily enzyme